MYEREKGERREEVSGGRVSAVNRRAERRGVKRLVDLLLSKSCYVRFRKKMVGD